MKQCKISLSKSKMTYNGKTQTPAVTVRAGKRLLKRKTNYTVRYSSNKKVGEAKIVIKGKGQNYSGTVTKTFKILPKPVKSLRLTRKKQKLILKWQPVKKQCSGYQVQYSTNKTFADKKTKTVTLHANKTTKVKIKGLKSSKKYYVRIRTYKTVHGKKYYSSWSKKIKK